ncbi:glycosyltransferase [Dyella ginsengisoli]|uniref:Glycosyltransferase n=1 Tax=Dyella ginsengisoli TaxID=363848 RepID=A0ABW8JPD1_9GAMM
MRIALVITSLGVAGAERLVVDLADRFASLGHAVLLVHLTGTAEVVPRHPDVTVLGMGMNRSPLSLLIALRSVRRSLKAFRPDLVNSHLVHASLFARLLRLTLPMPRLVSSAHNMNEGGGRMRMWAYRLTDWLVDISTNVSDEAVAAFVAQGAVKPGRMVTMHNGIDVAKFHFLPKARVQERRALGCTDRKLLLAVGRLHALKDYPNLIRAFAQVKGQVPGVVLAIAGEGPLRAELEALVRSLGLVDDVRFLGVRHDVPELMSACDVFVLSSESEGFGLVVAEAMACGRVVVATDCGGVREVVGDAGLLVPPRDPEQLAAAILHALALRPAVTAVMAQQARQRIERLYSLDTAAKKWLALYQSPSLPSA